MRKTNGEDHPEWQAAVDRLNRDIEQVSNEARSAASKAAANIEASIAGVGSWVIPPDMEEVVRRIRAARRSGYSAEKAVAWKKVEKRTYDQVSGIWEQLPNPARGRPPKSGPVIRNVAVVNQVKKFIADGVSPKAAGRMVAAAMPDMAGGMTNPKSRGDYLAKLAKGNRKK